MKELLKALQYIAEKYNLKPGDSFTVTVNAVGDPSIAYERKITVEAVEQGL